MMLRSWCTWHHSDGTCVQHRPCFCGKAPVFDGTRPLCIEHAIWNPALMRWQDPEVELNATCTRY